MRLFATHGFPETLSTHNKSTQDKESAQRCWLMGVIKTSQNGIDGIHIQESMRKGIVTFLPVKCSQGLAAS